MDCKTWVPEHELICCSNKNCEHAFVLKAFFFNCDCLLFYFKTWIVQACNFSKHWIKAMSSSLLVGSNCEHLLCLKAVLLSIRNFFAFPPNIVFFQNSIFQTWTSFSEKFDFAKLLFNMAIILPTQETHCLRSVHKQRVSCNA